MAATKRVAISAISGAAMAATVPLVGKFEGLYLDPYRDIVGVWTVCYGETAADGVKMQHYTKPECEAMLPKSLAKYDDKLRVCIHRELPDSMRIAFLSAAYNLGTGAVCGSSMVRLANAGELRNACNALLDYDHAHVKGVFRVVKGLHDRRVTERSVCLQGIAA